MKTLLCVTVVLALIPISALSQEQFAIYGFSYFTPPEGVGTTTTVVGFLEPPAGFTLPIALDFVNNEYTFYFQTTTSNVVNNGFTTTHYFADATFQIYEDPLKNGAYGATPPNALSPSTFTNGTLILTGVLSEFVRIDFNFGFPEPTVVAEMLFTGGTRYGDMPNSTFTFHGGLSANPLTGIPSGYRHNWSTKIVRNETVPTEQSNWGKVKNLYSDQ